MLTFNQASKYLKEIVGNYGTSRTCYLALSTQAGGIQGDGIVEPSAASYKRIAIGTTQSGSSYPYFKTPYIEEDGTTISLKNDVEIHFNEALESWGTLTHFAIYESLTGGNPIYVGALSQSISPTANSVPLIRVGNMKLSISTN